MDYTDFREKRNVNAIDVPEPELFIEEGPPVFPVANATHKSLVDGSTLESAARRALPDHPLRVRFLSRLNLERLRHQRLGIQNPGLFTSRLKGS